MHDKNGTEICVGDYVAFPITTGRDIAQIIELDPKAGACNVKVLAIGTHEVDHLSGVAGILRKVEDKLHVHHATVIYLDASATELVMLADGSLPVLEPTKPPALDQVAPGCATNQPIAALETGVVRTNTVTTTGELSPGGQVTIAGAPEVDASADASGSPVPPIPAPAG